MVEADLAAGQLRQSIAQLVAEGSISFTRLMRVLPELRGTADLEVTPNIILWRGLSQPGVDAIKDLYNEGSLFFWLCSPAIYANTGDAPFLRLMTRSRREGEQAWLPTLLCSRAPTADESKKAVREYVAEIARNSATWS